MSSNNLTIVSHYIFNECFEVGKFPATLKQANVIPMHKTSPKNVASNYRPISLLSPVSKVFEKLVYIRLEKFLTKHNIICTQQYGFRQGHSTEMAIVDLTNKLKLDILMKNILHAVYSEIGIYRDNLSAIVFYRLSLSLKIVGIYRLPISLL